MTKSPHVRRAAINVGRNSASSSGGREGSATGGEKSCFVRLTNLCNLLNF